MAKRYKMGKKKSKRLFTKTASRTHRRNVTTRATLKRGGYRL